MTSETKPRETKIYHTLRRFKALRDIGIDVTMDDLFSVAERGDRFLSVEELAEQAEALALRRKNKETAK